MYDTMPITKEVAHLLGQGRAHDWGTRRPNKGDRVIFLGSVNGEYTGVHGTITEEFDPHDRGSDGISQLIKFLLDKPAVQYVCHSFLWRCKPIADDLKYPADKTRGGYPVVLFTAKSDDAARPWLAKVTLPVVGETLLTYLENGQFYPGFEQAIDLVERC